MGDKRRRTDWLNTSALWLDEVPKGLPVTPHRPAGWLRPTELNLTPKAAEKFGRRLARTHLTPAPWFGAGPSGWSGKGFLGREKLGLAKQPITSWGEFFATFRLQPALRRAHDGGHLDHATLVEVERLCEVLRDGAYDDRRPPSRIHGNLWTGTLALHRNDLVAFAPAAHGGHAETDLATLALFEVPQLERIRDAWAELYQPADGWRERVELHQLHQILLLPELFRLPRREFYPMGQIELRPAQVAVRYSGRARSSTPRVPLFPRI